MYFTSNDRSQNMLVYQSPIDMLKLKKDKDTDFLLS